MKYLYLFTLNLLIINFLNGQTGCPGCIIDLPAIPEDTIFLSPASDGEVGAYYDGEISFRMPTTTDPVNALDPSTPAGLNIGSVNILAIANLPPGLSWEASMTDFDVSGGETDGCIKICGVPLASGLFEVEVVVEAFVLVTTQTASFSFPIFIEPASSSNDGFSMTNSSGCGEISVSFTNNNPSNGAEGFSYFWDFGNGNSTIFENPNDQIYDEPGVYEVNYEVTVDTTGFLLTSVTVLDDDCGDLIGGADLYIKIKDPNGTTIFESGTINDTPIPFTFNVNVALDDPGAYKLEVRDDDPFGDENCGDFFFTQSDNDTLTNGGTTVVMNIFHPVFTFQSTDTVYVFEQPETPLIDPENPDPVCTGQAIDLMADYDEGLQWYRDTVLLFGETQPILTVSESGEYWVQYTSPDGCQVESASTEVTYLSLPPLPIFGNNQNLLSVNDEDLLPANYELQWFNDLGAIPFANDPSYCMEESGEYTLRVTDLDTGCSSQYTFGYFFDPDFDCTTVGTADVLATEIGLNIFPNPSNGAFQLAMNLKQSETIFMEMLDVTGKRVWSQTSVVLGEFYQQFDFQNEVKGLYFLRMNIGNEILVKKIIIE